MDQGDLRKDDIIAMEKAMGFDLNSFVKTLKSGQFDKQKLQELGASAEDLIDTFTRMLAIKNS